MAVVEALLSSLFDVVLEKLVVDPLLEYGRLLKLDTTTTLRDWKANLLQIKLVLRDAEQRQIRDDDDGRTISTWLDDLKDLASDIEDVLDDIEAEALRRSLEQGHRTCKVRNLIPSFHTANFNRKISKKMTEITAELDAIVKRKTAFGLRSDGGESGAVPPSVNGERQTTSIAAEVEVYGREEDRERIIKLLLSDEVASAPQVKVIPIVGMGGIGKTALAQIIYNDKRMEDKDNFHVRGWACVSDQFHLETVTKRILESVSGQPYSSGDSQIKISLQLLQTKLQDELKEKKFLLVLDDVWMESLDLDAWSKLQAPLKAGASS